MTPHFKWSEKEWAAVGPGSSACLQKMFGPTVAGFEQEAIHYLYTTQEAHFIRNGITHIPRLSDNQPAGVSSVDIEHALCECEKYSRAAHPAIQGRRQKVGKRFFVPRPEPLTADVPPHWLDPACRRTHAFTYPPPEVVDGEELWEVSHIVAERKNSTVGNPSYLIRWVGYGPNDDTWERRSVLEDGAPEVLKQWDATKESIRRRVSEFQEMGPVYHYKVAMRTTTDSRGRVRAQPRRTI